MVFGVLGFEEGVEPDVRDGGDHGPAVGGFVAAFEVDVDVGGGEDEGGGGAEENGWGAGEVL